MTVKQGMKTKYDIIKEAEIKSVNPTKRRAECRFGVNEDIPQTRRNWILHRSRGI